jgi:hypothetical protein
MGRVRLRSRRARDLHRRDPHEVVVGADELRDVASSIGYRIGPAAASVKRTPRRRMLESARPMLRTRARLLAIRARFSLRILRDAARIIVVHIRVRVCPSAQGLSEETRVSSGSRKDPSVRLTTVFAQSRLTFRNRHSACPAAHVVWRQDVSRWFRVYPTRRSEERWEASLTSAVSAGFGCVDFVGTVAGRRPRVRVRSTDADCLMQRLLRAGSCAFGASRSVRARRRRKNIARLEGLRLGATAWPGRQEAIRDYRRASQRNLEGAGALAGAPRGEHSRSVGRIPCDGNALAAHEAGDARRGVDGQRLRLLTQQPHGRRAATGATMTARCLTWPASARRTEARRR